MKRLRRLTSSTAIPCTRCTRCTEPGPAPTGSVLDWKRVLWPDCSGSDRGEWLRQRVPGHTTPNLSNPPAPPLRPYSDVLSPSNPDSRLSLRRFRGICLSMCRASASNRGPHVTARIVEIRQGRSSASVAARRHLLSAGLVGTYAPPRLTRVRHKSDPEEGDTPPGGRLNEPNPTWPGDPALPQHGPTPTD